MEGDDVDSSTATTEKRRNHACQKCRILKVKCIRPQPGSPCLKCRKSKTQCRVLESKNPTRAVRRKRPQLSELTSKVDDIIHLLSYPSAGNDAELSQADLGPSPDDWAIAEGQNLPDWSSQRVDDLTPLCPDLEEFLQDANDIEKIDFEAIPIEQGIDKEEFHVFVAGLELSTCVLDQFLDTFRNMNYLFPFVVLPLGVSTPSLVKDHPVLLLGVIASTSSRYPNLQKAVAREFKETVTSRVVMGGEVDLDLLQGLLVYLAWHHYHTHPRSQETYRLLQIAISMVIDLGLDQTPADVLDQRGYLHLKDPSLMCYESQGQLHSLEAHRALLGCYYLSASYSFYLTKPNNFRSSDYMMQCAIKISQSQEHETDEMIHALFRMQRLGEEICDIYQSEISSDTLKRLPILAERFLERLEEYKQCLPNHLESMILLKHSYAIKIRILEMGIVFRIRQLPSRKSCSDQNVHIDHSKVVINLIQCVNVAKEYLDIFLAMPITEYHILPMFGWYRVILAIFVLYRLSIGLLVVPEWSPLIARETVNLEHYLGMIVDRLTSNTSRPSGVGQSETLFRMFAELFDSVRATYIMAKDHPPQGCGIGRMNPHLKALTKSNQTSMDLRRPKGCPAFQSSKSKDWFKECSIDPDVVAAEIRSIENEQLWSQLITGNSSR